MTDDISIEIIHARGDDWVAFRTLAQGHSQLVIDEGNLLRAKTSDEVCARRFKEELAAHGYEVAVTWHRQYSTRDALAAPFVDLAGALSNSFRAVIPSDAFEDDGGCATCGLGRRQTTPHLISTSSLRLKGPFYQSNSAFRTIIRADIATRLIDASGQPDCFRPVRTRAGTIATGWHELVPRTILPPMSERSSGVSYGPACMECGRRAWTESRRDPLRIVYDATAVHDSTHHAVVEMFEPYCIFPKYERGKGFIQPISGLPMLLLNGSLAPILAEYIDPEAAPLQMSRLKPVFVE